MGMGGQRVGWLAAGGGGGHWPGRDESWEYASLDPSCPCLPFVSAGLIDEQVGGAQQRPPRSPSICALHGTSLTCRISLDFPPAARGHWRQVARSLVPDLDTDSNQKLGCKQCKHGLAWHGVAVNRGSGIQGAEVSEALSQQRWRCVETGVWVVA